MWMKLGGGERTIWWISGRTSVRTTFSRSAERGFFFSLSNSQMFRKIKKRIVPRKCRKRMWTSWEQWLPVKQLLSFSPNP
ncbi:hypothetical protein F0562_016011 [Nyssa sinensis]|uniref:Uncharacterized protein n=1 Tax=Nyssa sinensis TaxID=561372 RepID=A0A5J4ZMU9_9ASTE|nr:hypothetical protein F0562_016011 [Nyssa sinensis]